MPHKTQIEGVVTIKDQSDNLIGIIYKDGSNDPIILSVEVMSVEDLASLLGGSLSAIAPINNKDY